MFHMFYVLCFMFFVTEEFLAFDTLLQLGWIRYTQQIKSASITGSESAPKPCDLHMYDLILHI